MHFLIIDDDDVATDYTAENISQIGCTSTIVSNPWDAYDLLKKDIPRYDIILLDNYFDDTSLEGCDFWSPMIHAKHSDAYVVGMSGNGATKIKFIKSGCQNFLLKPVTVAALTRILEDYESFLTILAAKKL